MSEYNRYRLVSIAFLTALISLAVCLVLSLVCYHLGTASGEGAFLATFAPFALAVSVIGVFLVVEGAYMKYGPEELNPFYEGPPIPYPSAVEMQNELQFQWVESGLGEGDIPGLVSAVHRGVQWPSYVKSVKVCRRRWKKNWKRELNRCRKELWKHYVITQRRAYERSKWETELTEFLSEEDYFGDRQVTESRKRLRWKQFPDPDDEMLESLEFEAIWQAIKDWDIAIPDVYTGTCQATGNHARAILESLRRSRGE